MIARHISPGYRPGARSSSSAVRYLRDLSTTWRKADGGPGRRMLAEALFSRIEVLGGREATIHLTDEAVAYGFAAVIPDRLDVTVGNGRGERHCPATTDHLVMRLAEPPEPCEWLRSA